MAVCSFVDRKCSTLKVCVGFVLFVLFNPLCALKTVFTKNLLVCVKSVVVVVVVAVVLFFKESAHKGVN